MRRKGRQERVADLLWLNLLGSCADMQAEGYFNGGSKDAARPVMGRAVFFGALTSGAEVLTKRAR